MTGNQLEAVLQAAVLITLIVAYVVIWAFGHQDTALLAIIGGQFTALGTSHLAQKARGGG